LDFGFVSDFDIRISDFPFSVFMEPKEARIIVERGTDVTLVTLEDENILEEQQIHRLERALLPIVRENEDKRLVLNFQNVKFMSSSFLGLLVKIHKRVVEMEGHLQLFNLDPKIHKVFEITQLVKVFEIVPPGQE
jgi:anti-anti-sigma factor